MMEVRKHDDGKPLPFELKRSSGFERPSIHRGLYHLGAGVTAHYPRWISREAATLAHSLFRKHDHELARSALDHGAGRYGDRNYLLVENGRERYTAAFFRHACSWRFYPNDTVIDQDSRLPHEAHALACIVILTHELTGDWHVG